MTAPQPAPPGPPGSPGPSQPAGPPGAPQPPGAPEGGAWLPDRGPDPDLPGRQGMQPPPSGSTDPAGDPTPPPPETLYTARVFWIVAALLGMLSRLLDAATSSWGSLPASAREPYTTAATGMGLPAESASEVYATQRVMYAVMAVLIVLVTLWLTRLVLRGRWWARAVLDVAGAFAVFTAVMMGAGVFMGLVPDSGRDAVVTFLVMAFQVLSGLCAGVALWRQHGPEAEEFLRGPRGRRR